MEDPVIGDGPLDWAHFTKCLIRWKEFALAESEKIYIIGIGEDGLDGVSDSAKQRAEKADLLIGENHTLALVPNVGGEAFVIGTDLDEAVARIQAAKGKKIVILAVGDPLFYGVARYLCDKLGKNRFEVVPHVSSMQLAFARVKESWEEAFLTNLARREISMDRVFDQIRGAEKVGLFTNESCSPTDVARFLLKEKIDYFTAYVCENLGSPDERVTHGELDEIAALQFSSLNVMILIRKPDVPDRPNDSIGQRLFGNPDEAFLQSRPKRGLLTPSEIRSIALAEMDLGSTSVVWDVGAGSGSVAIEAARIAREGTVYAIEMDPQDRQLIVENAKRFDVENLTPILGRAPEAWCELPDPDCVFVGGSGREISRLVGTAFERLRPGGRLVATLTSIDSINDIHRLLHTRCLHVKTWMLHFARGTYQLEQLRFESLNPTFLVSVEKPKKIPLV